jgi:predicted nucleic acid-binding protein
MEQEGLPGAASALIYLAKSDGYDEASRCVRGMLVPPSVWREAVAGESGGYPDVARIRLAEQAGSLRRVGLSDPTEAVAATMASQHGLGLGESEVLALGLESGRAIVDDGRAARVAERLGIEPISTLFLPVFGRRNGSLGESEALAFLQRLAIAANARAETVYVIEQFIRGVT